ncbi:hypothetical protein [Rhodococcus erythropolis]|uniref:hypothetical protein n=1 Tax=Rhodococcus erythropolis TaxID=1833 RepID=UPI001EE148A1|nr:hypothetical protein [Rhodococcus erythropolis]UKO89794.1 hypothetical protein ITJ47_32065 [Rhodococcus erythropolis]
MDELNRKIRDAANRSNQHRVSDQPPDTATRTEVLGRLQQLVAEAARFAISKGAPVRECNNRRGRDVQAIALNTHPYQDDISCYLTTDGLLGRHALSKAYGGPKRIDRYTLRALRTETRKKMTVLWLTDHLMQYGPRADTPRGIQLPFVVGPRELAYDQHRARLVLSPYDDSQLLSPRTDLVDFEDWLADSVAHTTVWSRRTELADYFIRKATETDEATS